MRLRDALREWDLEMEQETAKLIEQGLAPWAAAEQARKNVFRRRRCDRVKLPMMREAEESVLVKPTPKDQKLDGFSI